MKHLSLKSPRHFAGVVMDPIRRHFLQLSSAYLMPIRAEATNPAVMYPVATMARGRSTSLSSKEVTVVGVGGHGQRCITNILQVQADVFDRQQSIFGPKDFGAAFAGVSILLVIADTSAHQDYLTAEVIARVAKQHHVEFCFLFDSGDGSVQGMSEFDVLIQLPNRLGADFLCEAVHGIARIQRDPGLVGVDMHDISAALQGIGKSAFGALGQASGVARSVQAVQIATDLLFQQGIDLSKASGVVAMMVTDKSKFRLSNVRAVVTAIRAKTGPDSMFIFSVHEVEGLGDELRVTVIASIASNKPPK